jgi:hypothetical protein
LCLFDLVLLSRFFFLLLINSALFLGIYTRRESSLLCFLLFLSSSARHTRAARVRCKTIKRGPRDEIIAEVFLRVLLCAMMRVYSRARAKAKEMVL